MGHERLGFLPRTRAWKEIAGAMAVDTPAFPTELIAAQTLQNVRGRFKNLFHDDSVRGAFTFLVRFAQATGEAEPVESLARLGIHFPLDPTPLSPVKALRDFLALKGGEP